MTIMEVRHPIFSRRLEKGVIRRARLRVAVVPRADDLSSGGRLATARLRQFRADADRVNGRLLIRKARP